MEEGIHFIKQGLICGTATGALMRESRYGQSKTDFVHRLLIALKEANETEYGLSILKDTGYREEKLLQVFLMIVKN